MTQAANNFKLINLDIGYVHAAKKQRILVEKINLQTGTGELVSVIGKNGSGKSTLLRTLAGLQSRINGEILYNNKDISDWFPKERAKWISFVSAEPASADMLRVWNFVAMGRYPHLSGVQSMSVNEKHIIDEALENVKMTAFANVLLSEMSDGEKVKVNIARTLAQDTPIVILDEPLAFLDIQAKNEMIGLLLFLAHEKKKQVIFSSHDLNMALSHADKIWLFGNNEIAEGSPEDIVLSGKIEKTFNSDVSYFDILTGNFKSIKNYKAEVNYNCTGTIASKWTLRALDRYGFKVECNKCAGPDVILCENNAELKWKVLSSDSEMIFDTVYDLSNYLKLKLY